LAKRKKNHSDGFFFKVVQTEKSERDSHEVLKPLFSGSPSEKKTSANVFPAASLYYVDRFPFWFVTLLSGIALF
jgi:hypothetical protein